MTYAPQDLRNISVTPGTGFTVALLLVLNIVVWFVFPEWPACAMVLIVSLLVAPVLHTMLFRRR